MAWNDAGISRGEPARKELIQKIKGSTQFQYKRGGHASSSISGLLSEIEHKVRDEALPRAMNESCKALSNKARDSQVMSIYELNAICCGVLVGSIRSNPVSVQKTSCEYRASTNISHPYPYYLLHGRSGEHTIRGRVLRFSRRCGKPMRTFTGGHTSGKFGTSGFVFAYHVKNARPKNYMQRADNKLKPLVSGIVRRECESAFAKI